MKGWEGNERNVPWVAWDEDFWKAKDVDAFFGGVVDDGDCFCDGALEVKPDRLCLDGAETDAFGHCYKAW